MSPNRIDCVPPGKSSTEVDGGDSAESRIAEHESNKIGENSSFEFWAEIEASTVATRTDCHEA
jgi:hypothetical protein